LSTYDQEEKYRDFVRKKFLSLHKTFLQNLRQYAAVLRRKLPLPSATKSPQNHSYSLEFGEEMMVSKIIKTAHHFFVTLDPLSALLQVKIDRRYLSEIDINNEHQEFHDIAHLGVEILVSGLQGRTDSVFTYMSEINWSAKIDVNEESTHVKFMCNTIELFSENVQPRLPTLYFQIFCDKFASKFLGKYYGFLINNKKLSFSAIEQLLTDLFTFKALLLKMPSMKKDSNNQDSTFYSKYMGNVKQNCARIEMLLRLVRTPSVLLMDAYRTNCPNGTALGLRRVMTLKGMKENQQLRMLKVLGLE